jgi:hypothetical protein
MTGGCGWADVRNRIECIPKGEGAEAKKKGTSDARVYLAVTPKLSLRIPASFRSRSGRRRSGLREL